MRRIISSAAVLAAVMAVASPSFADIITPHNPVPVLGPTDIIINGVPVTLVPGAPTWHAGTDLTDPATNYWEVPLTCPSQPSGAVIHDASQQFDADPILGYSYSVDNNTASPMTINTSKTVFVSSVPAPTSYKGSIGISLTDNNEDGATVTDNGIPVYTASIDGSPVLNIFSPAYNFTIPATASLTDSFNSPSFSGPAVISTLTISLNLILSPGDSVAITSNFVVVPEPASLALLGLGAVGLLRRRR